MGTRRMGSFQGRPLTGRKVTIERDGGNTDRNDKFPPPDGTDYTGCSCSQLALASLLRDCSITRQTAFEILRLRS